MNIFEISQNGVHIQVKNFYRIKDRGIVFAGIITELPDGTHISSDDLRELLKDLKVLEHEIKGIELFAVAYQSIGRSIGLLVELS